MTDAGISDEADKLSALFDTLLAAVVSSAGHPTDQHLARHGFLTLQALSDHVLRPLGLSLFPTTAPRVARALEELCEHLIVVEETSELRLAPSSFSHLAEENGGVSFRASGARLNGAKREIFAGAGAPDSEDSDDTDYDDGGRVAETVEVCVDASEEDAASVVVDKDDEFAADALKRAVSAPALVEERGGLRVRLHLVDSEDSVQSGGTVGQIERVMMAAGDDYDDAERDDVVGALPRTPRGTLTQKAVGRLLSGLTLPASGASGSILSNNRDGIDLSLFRAGSPLPAAADDDNVPVAASTSPVGGPTREDFDLLESSDALFGLNQAAAGDDLFSSDKNFQMSDTRGVPKQVSLMLPRVVRSVSLKRDTSGESTTSPVGASAEPAEPPSYGAAGLHVRKIDTRAWKHVEDDQPLTPQLSKAEAIAQLRAQLMNTLSVPQLGSNNNALSYSAPTTPRGKQRGKMGFDISHTPPPALEAQTGSSGTASQYAAEPATDETSDEEKDKGSASEDVSPSQARKTARGRRHRRKSLPQDRRLLRASSMTMLERDMQPMFRTFRSPHNVRELRRQLTSSPDPEESVTLALDFEGFYHFMSVDEQNAPPEVPSLQGSVHSTGYDKRIDNIIRRALFDRLAIPNFALFCKICVEIFELVRKSTAAYVESDTVNVGGGIPGFANADPQLFGISICSVDGQQFSYGDADTPFCISDCHTPFTYALAVEEHGVTRVHRYTGAEPEPPTSSTIFTLLGRGPNKRACNPMSTAGGLVSASLLQRRLPLHGRFEYVANAFARFAGEAKTGFDNSAYLSLKDYSGDGAKSLVYYMRGNGVFRHDPDKYLDAYDLYLQCCATTTSCSKLAKMAATIANSGTNPTGDEQRWLHTDTTVNVQSLLFSLGLDTAWTSTVGLPVKASRSGAIFVIVPNTMAICIYSPPLNRDNVSVRGRMFYELLSQKYDFNVFGLVAKRGSLASQRSSDVFRPDHKDGTLRENIKVFRQRGRFKSRTHSRNSNADSDAEQPANRDSAAEEEPQFSVMTEADRAVGDSLLSRNAVFYTRQVVARSLAAPSKLNSLSILQEVPVTEKIALSIDYERGRRKRASKEHDINYSTMPAPLNAHRSPPVEGRSLRLDGSLVLDGSRSIRRKTGFRFEPLSNTRPPVTAAEWQSVCETDVPVDALGGGAIVAPDHEPVELSVVPEPVKESLADLGLADLESEPTNGMSVSGRARADVEEFIEVEINDDDDDDDDDGRSASVPVSAGPVISSDRGRVDYTWPRQGPDSKILSQLEMQQWLEATETARRRDSQCED